MCTVSINIDEATLRRINPLLTSRESISLTSRESISCWLQHQVDLMIEGYTRSKAERRKQALKKDMTPEQLYSLIAEEIDEIYANG